MHHTTAKLITLERIEDFLARGLPAGSHQAATNQAKALRQELSSDIIAAYGEIKARHKEAVVGVFENRCGGCHRPLSRTSLERLSAEREVSRCEHCGRFIYLASDLKLKSHGHSHDLAGDHSGR
jgi:C4-type zinc ribbon protein